MWETDLCTRLQNHRRKGIATDCIFPPEGNIGEDEACKKQIHAEYMRILSSLLFHLLRVEVEISIVHQLRQ